MRVPLGLTRGLRISPCRQAGAAVWVFPSASAEGCGCPGSPRPHPGLRIARLVLVGHTTSRPEQLLLQAFRNWPENFVADFLITPGGFVEGALPAGVPRKTGWQSDSRGFPAIRQAARKEADRILTPRLLEAARGKARYLTLGIDLMAAPPSRRHAELVAVVDLRSGRIPRWTGKSYPVRAQENTLWHFTGLESHYLELAGRRVLILGCHDLNMFSQRAWKKPEDRQPRRQRAQAMREIATQFWPDIVLHHPHTTESPRTWQTAWAGARRLLQPAAWASAIYYPGQPDSRALDPVLAQTHCPASPLLEIILASGNPCKYCLNFALPDSDSPEQSLAPRRQASRA